MPRNSVASASYDVDRSIGATIKRYRRGRGLNRHQLAQLAEIDPSALARIEEIGGASIQFATVCRIAEALAMSLDELAVGCGLQKKSAKRRLGNKNV